MTCENCICYDVCKFKDENVSIGTKVKELVVDDFTCFKDKNKFIALPCELGATVYCVKYYCDYKNCSHSDRMSCCGCTDYKNNKYIIQAKAFELSDLDKTIFLTKEEAEQKLKELKNNA